MKKLILFFCVALCGCSSGDISKVKVGMKYSEVKHLMGSPSNQKEWFMNTLLSYGDNLILVSGTDDADTVIRITNKQEVGQGLNRVASVMDSIEKAKEERKKEDAYWGAKRDSIEKANGLK